MENSELLVGFDEYPRYKIVAQVAAYYRADRPGQVLRVLEIGANAHKHLGLFLPDDEILYTDIVVPDELKNDPQFQQADGTALPFDDGSFDLVVATDVLEHVPFDKREALLREACRVAELAAVITFPHGSEDVKAAEQRVNEYYRALHGDDYIWLKEHGACGLPKTEDVDEILRKMGCGYIRLFHGDIRTWEIMYYAMFAAAAYGEAWDFNRRVNAYFNRELFAGDVSESCYRAIYVLCHGDTAGAEACLTVEQPWGLAEKTAFLRQLLSAQRQISPLNRLLALQRQCTAQEDRIGYLESQNQAMEAGWKEDDALWQEKKAQWERDAAQWEQYGEQWKRDVSLWENDKAQWENDRAQWEKDRAQWNSDRAQWEKDAALLKERSREAEALRQQLEQISNSRAWRLTKPLRAAADSLRRLRK